MLAGHHRIVARLIAGRVGYVTGGIHRIIALDLEVAIHMQAALAVAFAADLLGQRVGFETHGPDHCTGLDALAVVQLYAFGVHCSHGGRADPFDAQ
ncbi:hypothetical protein D3C81_919230 [compost metagenome]